MVQLPWPAAALPQGIYIRFYSGAYYSPAQQAHHCLKTHTHRPFTNSRSVCIPKMGTLSYQLMIITTSIEYIICTPLTNFATVFLQPQHRFSFEYPVPPPTSHSAL